MLAAAAVVVLPVNCVEPAVPLVFETFRLRSLALSTPCWPQLGTKVTVSINTDGNESQKTDTIPCVKMKA